MTGDSPLRQAWRRMQGSRTLANTAWLIFERGAVLVLTVSVGIWAARHLGPDRFGTWSYLIALSGLLMALPSLGLDKIIVRELVHDEALAPAVLGSSLVLRLAGGGLGAAAFLAIVLSGGVTDQALTLPALLMAGTLLLKAFDTIPNYFEARLAAKPMVYCRMAGQLAAQAARILLILSGANLVWFIGTTVIEAAVAVLGFVWIIGRYGLGLGRWRWSAPLAKTMLRDAWPLALSSAAVTIYMKLDQVMLTAMGGASMTGQYAAATRISEIWYFVPAAIASSYYPGLIAAKAESEAACRRIATRLMRASTGLALVVTVPGSLLAPIVCHYAYGAAYGEAGAILRVHMLAGIFVAQGVAMMPWLLVQGLGRFSLVTTLVSALFNAALNLVLIPKFGGVGAAWATLLTQAVATLGACLAYPPAREIGRVMVRALLPLPYRQAR